MWCDNTTQPSHSPYWTLVDIADSFLLPWFRCPFAEDVVDWGYISTVKANAFYPQTFSNPWNKRKKNYSFDKIYEDLKVNLKLLNDSKPRTVYSKIIYKCSYRMYSIRRLIRIIIQVYRRKEMFHKDKNQSALCANSWIDRRLTWFFWIMFNVIWFREICGWLSYLEYEQ